MADTMSLHSNDANKPPEMDVTEDKVPGPEPDTVAPKIERGEDLEDSQSVANSDKEETDTFEDAQQDNNAPDTSSVRSLTGRTPSFAAKTEPQTQTHVELTHPTHDDEDESDDDFKKVSKAEADPVAHEDNDTVELHLEKDKDPQSPKSPNNYRISVTTTTTNGELDNVSLDDGAAPAVPKKDVAVAVAVAAEAKMSPNEKEPTSKKLSLSSISNVLPAMPWSPPPHDSPTKTLAPATIAPAPISPREPAAPVPLKRNLTSAFSWLSRNSSKDPNTSPPAMSPRRNTASSMGTLGSNPELMLGRLDEEGGTNGNVRHSLKDRFKAMRMREEAGITSLPEEDDKSGIAGLVNRGPVGLGVTTPGPEPIAEKDGGLAVQPSASQVPPSPGPALAPGTASGAAAGASTLSDQPVDWDLWQSVVYEGPAAVAKTSPEELKRAIATGIPSAIRGVIWQVLAQSKSEDLEFMYKELVSRGTDKEKDRQSSSSISALSNGNLSINKEPTSSASSVHSDHSIANGSPSPPAEKETEATAKARAVQVAERKKQKKDDADMIQRLEKAIRRDIGARTSYSKFAAAQGLQEPLFGVCKAYALFDEEVGYAQGMNFLIMPFLFNMTEEEAFCLLVRLMNQYHLRDLFIQDMPGLHSHLYQFERLLEDVEPALYCHLRRRGISPHLYATQWFLTLFSYRFPLQLVLRIYDLIFSEGLSAILKFGIVLMQKNATTLLGISDMSHLTTYLRDRLFDVYIETAPSAGSILENGFFGSSSSNMDKEVYRADQLVHDACAVKITPEVLEFYKTEWEEKTKAEKGKEEEIETLRSQNIRYASKLRKLEERVESFDREQANLATELVHTKVENEELKDENDSLKVQVRELKNVIEKQPMEIEEQWKLERDDLMKRNQKVHEENEKVEQEMAELEEQLVLTKMKYAEINSQHETLTRKWTDLRKQFA